MKQSLHLSLSQQLTLTPQLKQSLKLLQLSSLDLEHEVQSELDTNPLLERVETDRESFDIQPEHTPRQDNNIPQPIAEASEPEAELERTDTLAPEQDLSSNWDENWQERFKKSVEPQTSTATTKEVDLSQIVGSSETLIDHLLWQLQMTTLSQRDQEIGRAIIGNLDDDGYLQASLTEIQSQFAPVLEIDTHEVQAVLSLIKTFEPMGVGTRNLRERLTLLLKHHYKNDSNFALAQTIIEQHLESLAAHHYDRLIKQLNISREQLSSVIQMITALQPRIALAFGEEKQDHIIPDLIVVKKGDDWTVALNPDNQIHLRVNDLYANLIGKQTNNKLNDNDSEFIDTHATQAKMFIKGLMSRYDTLLLVGQAIVERQQEFFKHGEQSMQAMIQQDIADHLELHESTVSRATAGKYLLSPRGVFELKYFFSSALSNTKGTSSSSTAIRSMIKQLIDAENKVKPLSDSKIVKKLEEQGHIVARRTVAKYRESLDIAPSSRRKSL